MERNGEVVMDRLKARWLIMFAMLLLLVGCSNTTNDTDNNDTNIDEKITISIALSKDHGAEAIEEKSITTNKNNNLLEIMLENFEIEEDNGFIQSINGLATDLDAEKGWIYYVNDEMAIVGAKDLTLSENDYVRFDYQAWE